MKYSKIIGTTAITLALGMAAPFAAAEMHGDHDKDMKHDKQSEHHGDMKHDKNSDKYQDKKARDLSPEANELGERTETGMGIEARPGSDGTARDVPSQPDVGLDDESEPGN